MNWSQENCPILIAVLPTSDGEAIVEDPFCDGLLSAFASRSARSFFICF